MLEPSGRGTTPNAFMSVLFAPTTPGPTPEPRTTSTASAGRKDGFDKQMQNKNYKTPAGHHKGDLQAAPGVVYEYESVGGYLYARGADTTTAFPKLTSVGDSLYASGADTTTAFPKLTSVGGYLYARGADTTTAFPKLTSVGGSLYASGDWAHVKAEDPDAARICRELRHASFAASGYSFADGVLARIVSSRGRVSRVVRCGQTRVSYLVTDGERFAHGDTLAAARDSLTYKTEGRDTTAFKGWTPDRVVTKAEGIRAYRAITGACEAGVRAWLEQRSVPENVTVKEIVRLTAGAYGADAFAAFFGGKVAAS